MTTKNTPEDNELLLEAVTSAWRPTQLDGIGFHPNWYDLDESGRDQAFDVTQALRAMEAALDPQGLSTTARAVLERIQQASSDES